MMLMMLVVMMVMLVMMMVMVVMVLMMMLKLKMVMNYEDARQWDKQGCDDDEDLVDDVIAHDYVNVEDGGDFSTHDCEEKSSLFWLERRLWQ